MRLTFSRNNFFGGIFGIAFTIFLIYVIGVIFFNIISLFEGSDYYQNLESIENATKGYYGGNTPTNFFYYLILDAHYYYWLGFFGEFTEDKFLILQGLTMLVTFLLIFPTAKVAGSLNNKVLLFPILLVIFLHPRFLDLVASNVRSAAAISLFFLGMYWSKTKFRYLLLFTAPTFHLSVLAPLGLYILGTNWHRFPKFFKTIEIKIFSVFIISGVVIAMAKLYFPERGEGTWEGGIAYSIALSIMSLYVFFLGRQFVNNLFGFMSIGLISLTMWGALLDYATMRYFNFFLPFFAASLLGFHKQPSLLLFTFFGLASFTLISHMTWLT